MASELEEAKKVNKFENDKNRRLSQNNAALTAKLKFIEENYNYSDNVNALNTELFNDVSKTNDNVSIIIL